MQDKTDTPAGALWGAAYQGDLETVNRLITEGVDVNVWDKYGRSGLTFAAKAGHIEVVRRLLAAGAWIDPFEEDCIFMTPLMCAAETGRLEIVELLLDRGANPTMRGGNSLCTAEYFARGEHGYVAAILQRAEDQWRLSHSDGR